MAAQDAITKQSRGLVSHYSKCYEQKYSQKPVLNPYRDRWGFVEMLDDPACIPYQMCKRVVEYYFKTGTIGHPLKTLFVNFDHIMKSMLEQEADAENRARLRKETEQRVREMEALNDER